VLIGALLKAETICSFFFCIAAIGAILWFYKTFDKSGLFPDIAFGMILSGAIGNLWDRIFHHHVRDFIDVHLGLGYHWPTFNIADSLICVGVGLILYETLFTKKRGSILTQKKVPK
jgi:signal peptidase II